MLKAQDIKDALNLQIPGNEASTDGILRDATKYTKVLI
jgi:hypothetical protein